MPGGGVFLAIFLSFGESIFNPNEKILIKLHMHIYTQTYVTIGFFFVVDH